MTTGTTGRPTSAYFTAHEMQTTALLSALTFLQEGQSAQTTSSRSGTRSHATLGNACFSQACQRIGAAWYLAGLVHPAQALALLAEEHHLPVSKPRASFLNTYPSYLGEARRVRPGRGLSAGGFRLARISVGGKVVTAGLKANAQQLFGPVAFIEGFGMSRYGRWPRPARGRAPALGADARPDRGAEPGDIRPGAPGEAGALVATPFAPYREASVVLRYDTEDVVTPLAGPCACRLAAWPATSDIQGKLRSPSPTTSAGLTPVTCWKRWKRSRRCPSTRCGFWAISGGVAVEAVVRAATAGSPGDRGALEDTACPCANCACWKTAGSCSIRCRCAAISARTRLPRRGLRSARPCKRPAACRKRGRSPMLAATIVVLGCAIAAVLLSWLYFRRYAIVRPPIGVFNFSDLAMMLGSIILIPYLDLALPLWVVAGLLVVGGLSTLYFTWEPILRPAWAGWLATLVLVGLGLVSWQWLGRSSPWWYAINNVFVVLSAVGITNL